MATNVDLEGSNTHLNPLEGENEVQSSIHHEEIEVIAAKRRAWH